jgi:hypothetical protein
MIKLLFGRYSTAVKVMEGVGLILAPFALFRARLAHEGLWHYAFIAAILVIYAFIRFCATVRWYKDVPRYSGIELQFKKALVPTGYTMTITFALYLIFGWLGFLIAGAFLLAVVAHVDIILLYFHFRDKDPTQVNFYTSGRFQKDPSSRT